MEFAETRIATKRTRETYRLHHLTDTHIDDDDHANTELRARIAEIAADPYALWVGGGDYYSLILPDDKRFTTPSEAPVHRLPDVYIEGCVERFASIADKCVAFGVGNHETTVMKNYHRGVAAEAAMQLGIADKYLGVRGWYILRFCLDKKVVVVKGYQYHGWSAGRLKGRKALQAERDVGAWRADIFTLGHDHQPYQEVFYTQECYDSKRGYRLRNRPVAIINGGAWTYGQKTPTPASEKRGRKVSEWPNESWAESKNFRPQPPVSPVLEIQIDHGNAGQPDREDGYTRGGRQSGFAFRTTMDAPMFDVG